MQYKYSMYLGNIEAVYVYFIPLKIKCGYINNCKTKSFTVHDLQFTNLLSYSFTLFVEFFI